MQKILLLASLLFPSLLYAQGLISIKGRIVNEQGEPVEYVHVGMPKKQIGTVSTYDGRFELSVPADTLEFHHVAYQSAYFPVVGPREDVLIVMKDAELPPAVFIGGKTKEKYLLRSGAKLSDSMARGDFYHPDGEVKGIEVGSIANVRKPFQVKDIFFSVYANYIPGCVASINIYRIEGDPESFVNVLHRPIYFRIVQADTPKHYDVKPDDVILLDPGRYFIAFAIVDCDADALRQYQSTPASERDPLAMHLFTSIYMKSSYQRDVALGELRHLPVNIGVAVKGLEYQ
ncbi:MAG: hypothetical protein IK008_00975 [Bacteroidales bacterium]|nr:hypothetical protein [Bacteroidales bacterium]